MSIFSRFKIWKFEKNRLEAFSDGVFAIIVTLLVLELKLPKMEMHGSMDLWLALKDIFPVLFSWVISFLIVGTFWLNHHSTLNLAVKADYAIVWLNTIFLLFASLIPFPTQLMGEYPEIPLAVASLGIVMLLASAVATGMYYYVAKNYLRPEYDQKKVLRNVQFALIAGPVFYGIAIASAWINTYITFIMYAVIPLIFILPLDKPTMKDD